MLNEAPLEPWQFSFYTALALHVILAVLVTYGPQFSTSKPKFENVYTIDLIELPPAPPPEPVIKPKEVEQVEKAVSIADPQPVKPTIEAQPISIAPKKKKIKKKIVDNTTEKIDRNKAIEQRKRLAEALKQEELARQKAEQAKKALEEERKLFETIRKPATAATATGSSTGSNRNSKQMNAVEAQWYAAVKSHLFKFWALPEFKQWDPELSTTVVVTVDKNGRIINEYVEKASGDKVFDQFV